MAFLIKKTIKRLWDGGSSIEFCPGGDERRYWENRKAAAVFDDADEEKAAYFVHTNFLTWPPAEDEEIIYENVWLTEEAAEKQRKDKDKPQYVEGRRSKWLKDE